MLYLANRWAALADFDSFCRKLGFPLDEATAVVVDLDKTALGARGRNDHVIDRARVEAVRRTIKDLLGDDLSAREFRVAYDLLNHVIDNNIELAVNICSQHYKNKFQKRANRIRTAQTVYEPFENVTDAGYIRRVTITNASEDLNKITEMDIRVVLS